MKSLKKISNYLLMVGGILTALSGIVNTTMDIVGNFKKEDKKEVVAPTSVPVPVSSPVSVAVIEQRIQGAPGVRVSKTVDMPAAETAKPMPIPMAVPVSEVPAPVEPIQPVATTMSLKETKNTLWWVIATIVGSFVASACWYIHGRLNVSVDITKKDNAG